MESFGNQFSESLISSLSYTLGRTSSAIVDRREAQVKPRGATSYTPRGAKTIEFTLTDSSSYALLNTIRFQAKLRAQDVSKPPSHTLNRSKEATRWRHEVRVVIATRLPYG